tara:strand:- start:372 stop:680 length:309 start_codon:yes stop_codon:yes gene_type:complete
MKYKKENVIEQDDTIAICLERDPNNAEVENVNYCAIPTDELIGSKIIDYYFENVFFNRDNEWVGDMSNPVIVLETKTGETRFLTIQRDSENNGAGYIGYHRK